MLLALPLVMSCGSSADTARTSTVAANDPGPVQIPVVEAETARSLPQLIALSDAVVLLRYTGSETHVPATEVEYPYSLYEHVVSEVVLGELEAGDALDVKVFGGVWTPPGAEQEQRLVFPAEPPFVEGDSSLLFLRRLGDVYVVSLSGRFATVDGRLVSVLDPEHPATASVPGLVERSQELTDPVIRQLEGLEVDAAVQLITELSLEVPTTTDEVS